MQASLVGSAAPMQQLLSLAQMPATQGKDNDGDNDGGAAPVKSSVGPGVGQTVDLTA